MIEKAVFTTVESFEARASLFKRLKALYETFHAYKEAGTSITVLISMSFLAPNSRSVKLVQVYLSVRKHLERSFHHCGGPVMHMQACSSA